MRKDGRKLDEIRRLKIKRNVMKFAEGSCIIELGDTKVMCSASIEEKVPMFLRGAGSGWVTAEYGMLPRSCNSRIPRESSRGKQSGRTQEIQRLIGRSLRSVVELNRLGERTVWIDCDVLQGDGGTRTASITGSFIALLDALLVLNKKGLIEKVPIKDYIAAISVGIIDNELCLDLNYEEDSKAQVDMNVVMSGKGKIIEIQGTAEKDPFTKKELDNMIDLSMLGIKRLIAEQKKLISPKNL
ncbi:MAG: ribonuclease PH [Candidatus Omnitrophota bacterium]